MKTDDDVERKISFSHWGGYAAGQEIAARHARETAGRLFGEGKDEQAKMWRDVAVWLEQLAATARKTQQTYRD